MSIAAIQATQAVAPGTVPASAVVRLPAAPVVRAEPDKPASPPQREPEPSEDLDQAVSKLNRYVGRSRTDLQFRIDEEAQRLVVSIVDADNGEVLRQMPSEDALRIARYLDGDGAGLLSKQA